MYIGLDNLPERLCGHSDGAAVEFAYAFLALDGDFNDAFAEALEARIERMKPRWPDMPYADQLLACGGALIAEGMDPR